MLILSHRIFFQGIDNEAYMAEEGQGGRRHRRRRSRHVYDNNVKTNEGFRIYDNAVPVNRHAVVDEDEGEEGGEEEGEIEHRSVSQHASVRTNKQVDETKLGADDKQHDLGKKRFFVFIFIFCNDDALVLVHISNNSCINNT